jgi:hypothetical protein
MTKVHSEYIAPCGLYCGVCRIRYATEENDLNYLKRLAKIYARRFPEIALASPDELWCDGCLSERRFVFCQECSIRSCTQSRGYQGCYECDSFPCDLIGEFPMPIGRKVILRTIPYWREHGTEEWVRSEEERYRCAECGQRLFRGARQCEFCQFSVNVD